MMTKHVRMRLTAAVAAAILATVAVPAAASAAAAGPARPGLAQLRALTTQISQVLPQHPELLADVVQWGPDPAGDQVVLYLNHADPTTAAGLRALFGSEPVSVSAQTKPWPHRTDRDSDTAPFYGGDAIWVDNGQQPTTQCTGGFTVVGLKTHLTYMLTAGHCAGLGTQVDTDLGTPAAMGPVTNVRYSNNGLDEETIGGSYEPEVYGNQYTDNAVLGGLKVAPGQGSKSLVTVDGAVTGEHRQLTVSATDQCVTFPGNTVSITCFLTDVQGFTAAAGDSGAPVYQYTSGGLPEVYAVGTVVGSTAASNETYVQQITDIESQFNVALDTYPTPLTGS
jgi:hypothetical protein